MKTSIANDAASAGHGRHPGRRTPSAPSWLLPASALVGALYGVAIWLGVHVHDRVGPMASDRAIDDLLARQRVRAWLKPYHLQRLDTITLTHGLVQLAAPIGALALVAAVCIAAWAWGDRSGTVAALAGIGTAVLLTERLLKPVIERTTRHGGSFYPSGHATAFAAIATAAVLLTFRRWHPGVAAAVALVSAVLLAAVSLSIIQLHDHYPSDVVGGDAVGIATCLLPFIAIAIRSPDRTHTRRCAPASPP